MRSFILFLNDADVQPAEAGGKGANLAELARGRFPVPAGFIVTTAAYRAFLRANSLEEAIADLARQASGADLAALERLSQRIRQLFEAGEVPDDLAAAVGRACAALGDVPLVVRSSATSEDLPEASSAGQQESYLNVKGHLPVLAAVKRCWSSLWTARAMAYRQRQAINPLDASLAVVVQQMVPAEVAGVSFTINPVTGNKGELLINATWGLGEALVAGQVNPDTVRIDKNSGDIKQIEVADKTIMSVATADGTAEAAVPPERRRQPSLTQTEIAEVALMSLAVEQHFGRPQDIEWAMAGGQVFVLQSRPVTGAPAAVGAGGQAGVQEAAAPGDDHWPPAVDPEPQAFDLWSQMDVGERWPEPVTPFTWSTWQPILNENMRRSDSISLLREPYVKQIEWARRAFGRVYFNEGAINHILTEGYGMPASSAAGAMGGSSQPGLGQNSLRWGRVLRRLPQIAWMSMKWERDLGRYEAYWQQIEGWVDAFMKRDLIQLDDRALWSESQDTWRSRLMQGMDYHMAVTSSSSNSLGMLERLAERWFGDPELAQQLMAGLSGVITAEIPQALWQMAEVLRVSGVDGTVRDLPPADGLQALSDRPEAEPFRRMLQGFLSRHGHRSTIEAEWLHPRWVEAPEQVVASIAMYLRAGSQPQPSEVERRQQRQRQELTAQNMAKLDPLRRVYFRWSLKRTQRQVRIRDNGQHYLVRLLLPMRRIYAALGERWVASSWLAEPDDFFFLAASEIEAVLDAGHPVAAGLNLPRIVEQRRRAYRYWLDYPAPDALDWQGQPVQPLAPTGDEVLTGIPASAGQARGVARVILDPSEASTLEPGTILVTRATDPGWTPVFSIISGLVLEIGGQLSHGAIVAREYGLPAVVNVPEATRRIGDGQFIVVDGSRGEVKLPSQKR